MIHHHFFKSCIPVTKGIIDVVDATLVVENPPELASVFEDGAGVDVIESVQFVSSVHFI